MSRHQAPSQQKKKDDYSIPTIDPLMGWTDITKGGVKALFGSVGGAKQLARGVQFFAGNFTGRNKKRAESDAKRKNTRVAFDSGRQAYSSFRKSEKSIESQYIQNLQSQRARFAGSGATLEGSWNQVVGQTLGQRDSAFSDLGKARQNFYLSDAGNYMQKAYRSLGGVAGGGAKKELSLGNRIEDYSKTSLFTRDQYYNIAKNGSQDNQEYLGRVIPTFEEYQTLSFGNVEDKSALQTDISQRINQANEWWAGRKASDTLNEMART